MNDTIVVMEAGGRFPSWVDEQNGGESNVWIVAQSGNESHAAFAGRVARHQALSTGQLGTVFCVCYAQSNADPASRAILARSLIDRVSAEGGNNVVLVADGGYALRSELTALTEQLIGELEERDVAVSLRFRALPTIPPPAPAQHKAAVLPAL